ncbi:MAG: SDR family oxidoreductase [Anaerolineae bacterium]|nr:SDR family oxidoreductase [Anaerolineae bacterium]
MGQLDGKVAIVVGGGSGIGKGIARALADEGCAVVIAGRTVARLEATAEELGAGGAQVIPIPTDGAKEDQVKALFAQTMARFGQLDILVNASGAFDGGPIDELSLEAWNNVMEASVTAPFLCTREAFAIMKKAGGGRIVNIGSISAQRSREEMAPYTTAKAAIWGLTMSTALEGRPYGIAASCIHPGNVMVERRAGDTAPMMSTEEIGRAVLLMVTLPPQTNVLELTMLPITQPFIGRG